ncbi:MAG: hypothetical protein ACRD0P_08090, partial [Stackebrandtia sp.]
MTTAVRPRIDRNVAEYVDAYVHGWAHSRRAPRPRAVEHGWYVPTGTATEPERYVLTSGCAEDVRAVRQSLTEPGSCLKFAGTRRDWLWLVDAEWEENPVGWFMTRGIDGDGDLVSPLGRLSRPAVTDNVAELTIEQDGQIIASGRAGLAGTWAIPDRIRTSPQHRRRGLGRFVMRGLLN